MWVKDSTGRLINFELVAETCHVLPLPGNRARVVVVVNAEKKVELDPPLFEGDARIADRIFHFINHGIATSATFVDLEGEMVHGVREEPTQEIVLDWHDDRGSVFPGVIIDTAVQEDAS